MMKHLVNMSSPWINQVVAFCNSSTHLSWFKTSTRSYQRCSKSAVNQPLCCQTSNIYSLGSTKQLTRWEIFGAEIKSKCWKVKNVIFYISLLNHIHLKSQTEHTRGLAVCPFWHAHLRRCSARIKPPPAALRFSPHTQCSGGPLLVSASIMTSSTKDEN